MGDMTSNTMQGNISLDLQGLAVEVGTLSPLPGNPRKGDIDAVMRSYAQFGQRKPIVARRADRTVIAGNHQLAAATALGWSHIAVVWTDDDDATAKAFALADNRTADLGSYDDDLLAALLAEVQASGDEALLAATGYMGDDLDKLLRRVEFLAGTGDPDDAPPLPGVAVSKPGDLWLLGPHRVLCGDATRAEDHATLLAGARADMVWTDPPYGIAYTPKAAAGPGRAVSAARSRMKGVTITNDASEQQASDAISSMLDLVVDVEAHFVCCDWRSLGTVLDAMRKAAIEPKACIVWDKGGPHQHLDRFAKGHELIVYAGPYGGEATISTDVWSFHREFRDDHPTPKPVDLVSHAITAASVIGGLVLDPFAGSGSTLIAANDLGRRAALIELDPRYVDVICRRYQEHTGDTPILEATGKAHDFTGGD